MKKIILSVAVLFAFGFANAQEETNSKSKIKKYVVKANPLAIFGGNDLISFESNNLGFFLRGSDHFSSIIGVGTGGFSDGSSKFSSSGIDVQRRYYFKEVFRGFYLGTQGSFAFGEVKINETGGANNGVADFNSIRLGLKGGHQWIFNSGFTLDLNLGYSYAYYEYKNSTFVKPLKSSHYLPNFGLGLGYAF